MGELLPCRHELHRVDDHGDVRCGECHRLVYALKSPLVDRGGPWSALQPEVRFTDEQTATLAAMPVSPTLRRGLDGFVALAQAVGEKAAADSVRAAVSRWAERLMLEEARAAEGVARAYLVDRVHAAVGAVRHARGEFMGPEQRAEAEAAVDVFAEFLRDPPSLVTDDDGVTRVEQSDG